MYFLFIYFWIWINDVYETIFFGIVQSWKGKTF